MSRSVFISWSESPASAARCSSGISSTGTPASRRACSGSCFCVDISFQSPRESRELVCGSVDLEKDTAGDGAAGVALDLTGIFDSSVDIEKRVQLLLREVA